MEENLHGRLVHQLHGRTGGAGPPSAARHSTTEDARRTAAMANIKSQIKRIRTNEAARLRNKAVKSSVKTSIRKFREAAEAGDKDKALVLLRTASRELDKAASKGVIHLNQAANKKSAMAARANKIA
jgi:small subunit ribosomal protein S20